MIDERLWERQMWDTEASYNAFHKYYLPQPIPRSLDEAYRMYRVGRYGESTEGVRGKQSPGNWTKWFYAQNKKGEPIPDAVGWAERATALDDFIARQAEARWIAREIEQREADWSTSLELREAGLAILKDYDKFLKTSSRLIPGDPSQGINDREVITLKLNISEGIKMLALASELGRKATQMEQPPQRIITEIDKEVNYILAVIEQVTDEATYTAILSALQSSSH